MEFHYIYLNNFKCAERKKSKVFFYEILILPPLGICCPGQPHHLPRPSYAPGYGNEVKWKQFAFTALHVIVRVCVPTRSMPLAQRLRWSRGSVPAFGTQVREFAPGRRIFRALFFGGEVKPSVPCRNFTACKRSLNVMWKSAFWQNSRTFLAHSSTFRSWVLSHGDTSGDAWWRKLERLTQIAR